MRKKKETPLGKIRGRPKNSGLIVPSWAHKAIASLSANSGVTAQKILEAALRDGIQLVREPLGAWVKYQESSEKLWNEHQTSPAKVDPEIPEDSGPDNGDPGFAIASDRLHDADLGHGFGPEGQESNGETEQLLTGE